MPKILVSLLDDHPLILTGLQQLLQQDPDIEIGGLYATADALLLDFAKHCPDILLLDIQMPELSGDELALILSKKYPQVRIIILSNLDYPYYIKNLLQYGIMGYLLKSSAKEKVIAAIKAVYAGEQYIDAEVAAKVMEYKRSLKMQQTQPLLLTKREKEILQLIARDYTSQEIAEELYLSKRTIDTHRNSLLLKLDVKNSAGLIKKAMDLGLLK